MSKLEEQISQVIYSHDAGVDSLEEMVTKIKEVIKTETEKAKMETLELIASDMGWEESYNYYAEKLNLPIKDFKSLREEK